MNARDWQFADALRVVEDSLAIRFLQAARSVIDTAFAKSRAVAIARRVSGSFMRASSAERTRRAGVFVAAGCLAHVALVQSMPRRLAPAVPAAWWIAAALAAGLAAVFAVPLNAAWRNRRDSDRA